MEKLLREAVTAVSKLPASEREAIGAWLLAEMESERRWDESFSESRGALEQMADQALKEHTQALTTPLDPDHL